MEGIAAGGQRGHGVLVNLGRDESLPTQDEVCRREAAKAGRQGIRVNQTCERARVEWGLEDSLVVVVLSYNRAHLVERTLQSVMGQTRPDFQCVVVDDASSDGADGVARRAVEEDDRFVVVRNARNLGMPHSLNSALDGLNAKYVAVAHDGDWWDPDLVRRWREALDVCPDAGLVFNRYKFVELDGTVLASSDEDWPACMAPGYLLWRGFLRRWNFDSPVWGSALFRLDVVRELGLLDCGYGAVADVDLWLKVSGHHHVGYASLGTMYILDRRSVASNWASEESRNRRLVRKAFWHARLRATEGDLSGRMEEVGRHCWYVWRSETRRKGSRLWRSVVRPRGD